MKIEQKKFLHDITAELLNLPKNKVIWANQEGCQLKEPFATLQYYAERAEAMANHLHTDVDGVLELRTPTAFTLEVQYFGSKKEDCKEVLNSFVRQLERPSIVDEFYKNRLAYLYADSVQDMTSLLVNTIQVEPRAMVDLHLRYTACIEDTVGWIENVDWKG